jgi:serine/threonine-protein kinase
VETRVGTAFGKYRLRRLIGKGGMGEVYEAYDSAKDRTVALKILADAYSSDVEFRTRFQRESHAAAILQEPHVIPIHDWGEIEGNLYIDMRLVEGRTLADLIERGRLAPPRAVAIICQIAAALDAAHIARLIHRDIKPQNILVTPADFAYLVDFGIAESRGATRLTMTGTQIGTVNYMAPERFSDQAATPAVDVYALTCVLYEALTGDPPFKGPSLERILAAHHYEPPPRPSVADPRIPPAFDNVIARGMAKDPDDRYGTAGGLGRAAQRALQPGEPNLSSGPNHAVARTVPLHGGSPPPPWGERSDGGNAWGERVERRPVPPYAASAPSSAPPPYQGHTVAAPVVPSHSTGPVGVAPYSAATVAVPPPPTGPLGVAPSGAGPADQGSGDRGRAWVVPTVVGAIAALVLGGILVVFDLLDRSDAGQTPRPSSSVVHPSGETQTGKVYAPGAPSPKGQQSPTTEPPSSPPP